MAYNQPVRFQYRGDKTVALRYVREARRLLFLFLEELTKTGARSGRRISKLPDGGSIELVVAHQQITATITTPLAKKAQVRSFDDFVVHPRDTAHPDGIDAEHPQLILRAPIGREPWRTFFYDQNTPGYDDFTGPKGTYRRNPDGTELFPDGITSAGNIDWLGPNGERISWYGPDTRYWYDAFRQPRAQYGRFVFCLGQVLLDIDQYCIDTEDDWSARLVLGAGLRDLEDGTKWLYLITAALPDVSTPSVSVPPNGGYVSQCFPRYNVTLELRAIRLEEDLDTASAQKWKPSLTDHVLLWTAAPASACNPVVFNRDCTKAVFFIHTKSTIINYLDIYSTKILPELPPSPESYRVDLTITEPLVVTDETTVISVLPHSSAPCAADFDANNEEIAIRISREPQANSPSAVVLYLGAARFPVWYQDNALAPGYPFASFRRALLWCDAREGAAMFDTQVYAWTETTPYGDLTQRIFEVARGGVIVRSDIRVSAARTSLGFLPRDRDIGGLEAIAEYNVAPFLYIWQQSIQTTFTNIRVILLGLSASSAIFPHDTPDVYGQYRANGSGAPQMSIPIPSESAFFNNRADKHGHKVVASGAVKGETIMVGSYDPRAIVKFGGFTEESISFATGNNLPNLTGVGGTFARYSPIWLLGAPIGGEKP